jgi:hypothetical protein
MKTTLTSLLLLVFTSYYSQSLPNYVPSENLEAWWSFESSADDLSQNSHNGIVNSIDFLEDFNGVQESSAFFNGTASSYIRVSHSNNLDFTGGDDYTIAMWIKPLDNPGNGAHSGILTKWNENQNTTSYPYRIATTDLGNGTSELVWVNYNSSSGTQNILSTTVFNGRYVHIAYVVENNVVKLYKNGYYESSLEFGSFNYSNLDDIYIGKRNVGNNRRYHGNLDEMGIWSRPLSECEVRALATFDDGYNINYEVINNGSGGFEVINTSTAPDSYQWYQCVIGGLNEINGEVSSTYTPQSPGEYSVELIYNGLNCSLLSDCFDIQTLDNIDNKSEEIIDFSIILYPNPAYEVLNIKIKSVKSYKGISFTIVDDLGRVIEKGELTGDITLLNIFHLDRGVYSFIVEETGEVISFVKL